MKKGTFSLLYLKGKALRWSLALEERERDLSHWVNELGLFSCAQLYPRYGVVHRAGPVASPLLTPWLWCVARPASLLHGAVVRGVASPVVCPASPSIIRGTYARYGVLSRLFRYARHS
jgi:hypothetical protein